MISTERQRWGRIAAGVLLTAAVAAIRGQVLLLVIALALAVPTMWRLLELVRVRRTGTWHWPTPATTWPGARPGFDGVRGVLALAFGACLLGLVAAALHVPSSLVTILACVPAAMLLVAPPAAVGTRSSGR